MLKTISKFALIVIVAAILYLLLSGNLISRSPLVISVQILAVGLSVWARQSFQSGQFSIHAEPGAGPLLASGAYRFIRHPMYAAALLLVWSSLLGHLSPLNLLVCIIASAVTSVRIITEDQFLLAQFPGYAEYARTTKRIIPFVI